MNAACNCRRILLIRHGETAANEERRYCGSWDIPLSEQGRRHVLRTAAHNAVRSAAASFRSGTVIVYASPLMRAVETASLLFPQARVVPVPGFAEMDFGAFEQHTAAELASDARYRAWVDSGCTRVCPGGESKSAFQKRVCAAFRSLPLFAEDDAPTAAAEELPYLIITAHGGTVMALCEQFLRGTAYFDVKIPNCGIAETVLRRRGAEQGGAADMFFSDMRLYGV